jgi:hypothetical protein
MYAMTAKAIIVICAASGVSRRGDGRRPGTGTLSFLPPSLDPCLINCLDRAAIDRQIGLMQCLVGRERIGEL